MNHPDVCWKSLARAQCKVLFVSPQFSKYQRQAINFNDLPIELWEVIKYENDSVLFNQLQSPESSESISLVSQRNETVRAVSREIKVLTENDHIEKGSPLSRELWEELKERVLSIGENVSIKYTKYYVAFKGIRNFTDVRIQKSQLKLWLNLEKGTLDDPKGISRDISNIGHWGNGDYEIIIKSNENLDYIMSLIKQSYKKHS